MDSKTRQLVRDRANNCCEYCGRPQSSSTFPLQVEHVIPKKHDGTDEDSNLALACMDCNLAKGRIWRVANLGSNNLCRSSILASKTGMNTSSDEDS